MRFGNFPPESDHDYAPLDIDEFDYDLTCFGYKEKMSLDSNARGLKKNDLSYVENYRFDDMASHSYAKKPPAVALLKALSFGNMASFFLEDFVKFCYC